MDRAEIDRVLTDPDRLAVLEETGLPDDPPAEALGRLTRLAVRLLDVPAAFVTLAGAEEEHFVASVGLAEGREPVRTAPVGDSFCRLAITSREPLVVRDAREDDRVRESPLVAELGIVAYLGVPLITQGGHALGAFCVTSPEPRAWSDDDLELVDDLAASAASEIELRIDRTRRRELEDALRRREAWFRGIVENVGDVITVLDDEGRFVFTAPSVERVLGWKPGELKGDRALEHIHPEDRERIAGALEEIGSGGGRVRTEEYRFRHADGDWRTLEATGHAMPGDAETGGIVVTARDVTDRRRLEEQVRLLATAVQHAQEGVVVTDAELERPGPRIVYVNPTMTRLTGYERDELVGSTPRMLQGPATEREVLDDLRASLEAGEPFTGETVNYRKDGSEYVVRWTVAPVRNEEGETSHYVAVQRDVTEQRRYRERLEEAVAERTRDLERARREVLERLARAAEYRDDETGEHTRRVGRLTARLARALDLPEDEASLLGEVAPLHDLGKIGIPDDILLKEGPLTDEEFEVMKRHTVIGADLLAGGSSDLAVQAETIARSHHERWDGRGYPRGLEGEAIPLAGRMVAVVDAFDAMTHRRPYKPAWPVEKAIGELRDGAGGQFDPRVVEAFLAIREEAAALVREGLGELGEESGG